VQHKNHIAEDVACVGGGFADGSDIEGMFAELEEMDKQSKKKVREVRKKPKTSNRKK
jgi:acetoin utilization deacetylase AcuC-like enzyme